MAAFVPYDQHTDLPPPGALETDALDFKGGLSRLGGKPNYAELAKDIAAFANAHGGVILIGAVEDQRHGVLREIRGLSDADVKEVRDAYSKAATEFCSPSPVTDSKVIEHATGQVVAVNIWPFPGQAVGVRDAEGYERWRFPLRSNIDTTYLSPEQLPMLMIPELRRKIALLRAIPSRTVVSVDDGGPGREWRFMSVEEDENSVHFEEDQGREIQLIHVALEQIERVWRANGRWWLHVGPHQRGLDPRFRGAY